jgi:hypothetical protein
MEIFLPATRSLLSEKNHGKILLISIYLFIDNNLPLLYNRYFDHGCDIDN